MNYYYYYYYYSTAQAISQPSSTMEDRVQSQASPCAIYGEIVAVRMGFLRLLLLQYHLTNASLLVICHRRYIIVTNASH
jgi:hypothetical protein